MSTPENDPEIKEPPEPKSEPKGPRTPYPVNEPPDPQGPGSEPDYFPDKPANGDLPAM